MTDVQLPNSLAYDSLEIVGAFTHRHLVAIAPLVAYWHLHRVSETFPTFFAVTRESIVIFS